MLWSLRWTMLNENPLFLDSTYRTNRYLGAKRVVGCNYPKMAIFCRAVRTGAPLASQSTMR